jgi:hypothetical protein
MMVVVQVLVKGSLSAWAIDLDITVAAFLIETVVDPIVTFAVVHLDARPWRKVIQVVTAMARGAFVLGITAVRSMVVRGAVRAGVAGSFHHHISSGLRTIISVIVDVVTRAADGFRAIAGWKGSDLVAGAIDSGMGSWPIAAVHIGIGTTGSENRDCDADQAGDKGCGCWGFHKDVLSFAAAAPIESSGETLVVRGFQRLCRQ